MKKILLLILFILCSCSKKKSDMITYLNNNDAAVYLYNEAVEDDFGMNNITRINAIKKEEFIHSYTCIIINVEENRTYLNEDLVNSLYDLLLDDNSIMIIFYEGKNYDFLKNTKFSNEKDYYDDVAQICSYNNFNKKIKNLFLDTNIKSYHSCLSHFESKIKEFRGSL